MLVDTRPTARAILKKIFNGPINLQYLRTEH